MRAMAKKYLRNLGYSARRRNNHIWSKVLTAAIKEIRIGYDGALFSSGNNGEAAVLRACIGETRAGGSPVVFDVGANVGEWTEQVLKVCPTATVHVFEPMVEHAAALMALAQAHPNIHVNNRGIGATDGTRTMVYEGDRHPNATAVAVNQRSPYTRSIECEFISPGEYLRTHNVTNIDFLKIDTEGSDFEVAKAFLDTDVNIKSLQFEFTVFSRVAKSSLKDFYDELVPRGYSIFKIFPNSLERIDYNLSYEWAADGNYIAVRNGNGLKGLKFHGRDIA